MKGKNKFFSILILFVFLLTGCSFGGSSSGGAEESYTIKWKNYDGTILETDDVKKGVLPTYDGPTPIRQDDDEYTYTWSGWDPEVVPATANQTYVATYSYERTAYTINFDLNGGTSASYNGSKTVEEFTKDVFFFDCVKEGWNFRGWSYNGTKILDEKGNQLANPTMAKNMTFVAIYAQTAKMTIVTNLEGVGIITGEGEYPYNSYVDVSAYAKQGYKFIGWYFQDTLLSNTNEYKYMMWSEDVTLEVRFEIDSFLLNIHSNNKNYGLVLLKSNINNEYLPEYQEYRDYTTAVTIAAYSKTDVRFLGWYDTENKLVETNAVYNFVMPNYDYTLEAKWNYFTVTYNLNGGTNNSSNPTSYTIDSTGLTLGEPTRTGYDFLGWKYKGNFVTEINPCWIDNIELNAIWRAHTYSISYELNGGTNNSSNPTSYTIESSTITLKDATRNDYTFAGWYMTSTFSNKVTTISSGSYGDLTLYAKWTPVSYSITYNLDGGTNASSNPSTYTIESAFTFAAPSKTGYTFLGWFDNNGNQVTSIVAGTTGALTLTAHWNEGDSFTATLDANGGSVSETLINVQYDHSYSFPTPSRLGYTFDGWYDGSTKVNNTGIWKYTSNKTFVAHWTVINYSINYTINGGTNNPSNPSTYTVEDAVTFAAPSKTGYGFAGWFSGDNAVTGIPTGSTGEVNIEARWLKLNSLSVTSVDTSKGTVTITSGSGYSGESITVVATPVGDCVFKGWYHKLTKVSDDATYTFIMPTSDYSLVAHFLTKAEEEEERAKKYASRPFVSADGKTITYGLYPQTNVNNSSLVSALNALTTFESNGWYLYEGDYYAKVSATLDNSTYVFDNGTTIVNRRTYWFKCEPIVWNVLNNNNGEYYIVSSVLLDAHCYYNSISLRTIDGQTVYPNNYKYSGIRAWLNADFYNSAFALGNEHIQTTTVNNSASTTDDSSNSCDCANTEDKVFLPSYQDYINSSYGFSTSTSSTNTRYCRTTDWARARGACYYTSSGSYQYNGDYWTRSPYSYSLDYAWCVYGDGNLRSNYVDYTNRSVRPGLSIKIA
ncbi:MAG: InlB B-repeat-containing protein [Candidatus Onthovivens sp.]|nr:InlB B-repeat-containing protein [Candidatus Onthovivens sp.]